MITILSFTFPSGLDSDRLEDKIDTIVGQYLCASTYGAAISISSSGEEIFSKAYGYSNWKKNEAMELTDSFDWGTLSSLVTIIATMQLVEQGKISLDDPIKKHLSSFVYMDGIITDQIAIQRLLSHWVGYEDHEYRTTLKTITGNIDLSKTLAKIVPRHHGNGDISFSTHGIGVLGLLIEQVTKLPLYKYARQNIFDKLNMTGTTIDPARRDVRKPLKKVQGYTNKLKLASDDRYIIYPAQGAFGPFNEFMRLARELEPVDGKQCVLFDDPDTLSLLYVHTNGVKNWGIGNGLWERLWKGNVRSYEHPGDAIGFASRFIVLPFDGYTVSITTNAQGEQSITTIIPELLFGVPAKSASLIDTTQYADFYQSDKLVTHGLAGFKNAFDFQEIKSINGSHITFNGASFERIESRVFYNFDSQQNSPFIAFIDSSSFLYHQQTWSKALNKGLNDISYIFLVYCGISFNSLIVIIYATFFIIFYTQRKTTPLKKRIYFYDVMNFAVVCLSIITYAVFTSGWTLFDYYPDTQPYEVCFILFSVLVMAIPPISGIGYLIYNHRLQPKVDDFYRDRSYTTKERDTVTIAQSAEYQDPTTGAKVRHIEAIVVEGQTRYHHVDLPPIPDEYRGKDENARCLNCLFKYGCVRLLLIFVTPLFNVTYYFMALLQIFMIS